MTEHEVTIEIPAFSISFKVSATEIAPEPPPPPPDPLPEPGTAYAQVQGNTPATTIAPHDLLVCNPTIDTSGFDPKRKPGSIVLFYSVSQIMPSFGPASPWWNGIRAVATEADYWHTASPPSIANRVLHSANIWHVRPSASLANRIADFVVANANPYFMGTMADESNPVLPAHYLAAYRTAIEWVEADLPKIQADWVASVNTYLNSLKAAWGSAKAVIANSAGTPGPDGFTVEASHILAKGAGGVDWVKANVLAQKAAWDALPNRFGTRPIVVAWNYAGQIPGVYIGTSV